MTEKEEVKAHIRGDEDMPGEVCRALAEAINRLCGEARKKEGEVLVRRDDLVKTDRRSIYLRRAERDDDGGSS